MKITLRAISCIGSIALLSGCMGASMMGLGSSPEDVQRRVKEAQDANSVRAVAYERARATRQLGNARAALGYMATVELAYKSGTVARGKLNGQVLLQEVEKFSRAALDQSPQYRSDILLAKGKVYVAAQQAPKGIALLRESMEAKPNIHTGVALIEIFDQQGNTAEVIPMCKQALPTAGSDNERFYLLENCLKYSRAQSVEQGLAWAGRDNIQLYINEKRGQMERQRQRAAERRARAMEQIRKSQARQQCAYDCKRALRRCRAFCPDVNAPCGRICRKDFKECDWNCRRTHD